MVNFINVAAFDLEQLRLRNKTLILFGLTANSVSFTCSVLSPTWVTLMPPYSWGRSSSLTLWFSWLSGRCFWKCLNTKNTMTTAMMSTPMGTSTAITMYILIGNSSSTVKSKLGHTKTISVARLIILFNLKCFTYNKFQKHISEYNNSSTFISY